MRCAWFALLCSSSSSIGVLDRDFASLTTGLFAEAGRMLNRERLNPLSSLDPLSSWWKQRTFNKKVNNVFHPNNTVEEAKVLWDQSGDYGVSHAKAEKVMDAACQKSGNQEKCGELRAYMDKHSLQRDENGSASTAQSVGGMTSNDLGGGMNDLGSGTVSQVPEDDQGGSGQDENAPGQDENAPEQYENAPQIGAGNEAQAGGGANAVPNQQGYPSDQDSALPGQDASATDNTNPMPQQQYTNSAYQQGYSPPSAQSSAIPGQGAPGSYNANPIPFQQQGNIPGGPGQYPNQPTMGQTPQWSSPSSYQVGAQNLQATGSGV